jgi:hypothetical protein
MSQTLTYGMKIPEAGDTSATWMPDIEDNFTQLDGHTHNGIDSPPLTAAAFVVTTVNAPVPSWTLVSNGTYKQTVNMPGALQYDDKNITLRNASTGDMMFLTVKKVSATSFDIYINDNTISVDCLIGA